MTAAADPRRREIARPGERSLGLWRSVQESHRGPEGEDGLERDG